jgi:hypothetical protein
MGVYHQTQMTTWAVINCTERSSNKFPGSTCWRITLRCLEDKTTANTYIEENFNNIQNWREVIENHPQGQIITNISLFKRGLVNADSLPQVLFVVAKAEFDTILERHFK